MKNSILVFMAGSLSGPWTGWICSAPVQIHGYSLGDAVVMVWWAVGCGCFALIRRLGWRLPALTSPNIAQLNNSEREIKCLLYDSHQKGKMMSMMMKTLGSQVDSPVAEGNRKEGGGRTWRWETYTKTHSERRCQLRKGMAQNIVRLDEGKEEESKVTQEA